MPTIAQIVTRTYQSMHEGPIPPLATLMNEPWVPWVLQWVKGSEWDTTTEEDAA